MLLSILLTAILADVLITAGDSHSIVDHYSREDQMKCSNESAFCSPWVYCDDGECKCGGFPDDVASVQCQVGKNLSIFSSKCVTYNKENQTIEFGTCIYNMGNRGLYATLPSSLSELNETMCGNLFNRTGTLCGKCKDGHYLQAYSFDMNCIRCPNGRANWWKYLLAAYLPLTAFYLLVLAFRINVALSSFMYPFVAYAQGVTFPVNSRMVFLHLRNNPMLKTAARWVAMIYGIWNLDFFRSFDLGICLGTDTLQTLALDLAVGVYPLLLMLLTYVLIRLYDSNFKPIVVIWRPFRAVFGLFEGKVKSGTSLIDVFCTFFFLTNTKLLSASIDILVPVHVYQLNSSGHLSYTWRVFNDATMPYFGHQHLPYAILAIVVLVLFALFPTVLLTVYPFRWFQKLLNLFPIRWYILHTFVDSFQGAYTDGTKLGTRDCRWFASLIFIARYAMMLIGNWTFDSTYFPLATMVLTIVVILLVVFQPFKQSMSHLTHITIMFTSFLALSHIAALGISFTGENLSRHVPFMGILFISLFFPLLYISGLILHWLCSNRAFGVNIVRRIQARRRGYEMLP